MLQTQNGIFIVTPFAMPHNSNKRTTLSCIGERHRSRSINEIESDAHVSSADIALENYCVDVSKEMLVDVLSSGVNMTNEGSRRSAWRRELMCNEEYAQRGIALLANTRRQNMYFVK